ncbi:fimbrial assembly protein fimC [Paenibacillus sp. J45TS6]|uniref:TraX family protein n=1 Tax=Paenibacillus sp. J45TS6 TaxID=2807196 RepID=UPI001B093DF8|nr:TraX family protein [Paenibacillus sp. J45TS6]GIP46024.1 fimbrial assembly protein fimC [Paenibacillus sp. J45TS6]
MLYWIAMLTMLIDHIGAIFYQDQGIFRIIGRLAFPIYAFSTYLGYKYTRNMKRYTYRLLLLAIISQIPFMLAFQHSNLNVIWTLLSSLLVLQLLDKSQSGISKVLIVMISGILMELSTMDYGIYGLFLILIFRYTEGMVMVGAHLLLNIADMVVSELQIWSTLATVYIAFLMDKGASFRSTVPRWLWVSFYPLHLAVLAVIRIV